MDLSTGLIFLCLLVAPAASRSVSTENGTVNKALQEMSKKITTIMGLVDYSLPQIRCSSTQAAELDELQRKPLLTERLSAFRCRLMNMTKYVSELKEHLLDICEHSKTVEESTCSQVATRPCKQVVNETCTLPSFDQDIDRYLYVMCLLQRLSQEV